MLFKQNNERISELKNENEELRRSLEFSQNELTEFKGVVERQERKVAELESVVSTLSELPDRVREMEDYSRRNNVRVSGIPPLPQENSEKLQAHIQAILREKMNISPTIDVVHRTGQPMPGKPRPVVVRFVKHKDRQDCLKSTPKLKGSDIYISEDLSKATVDIQKLKRPELDDKRRQGYVAYFSGSRIIAKKRLSKPNEETITDGLTTNELKPNSSLLSTKSALKDSKQAPKTRARAQGK